MQHFSAILYSHSYIWDVKSSCVALYLSFLAHVLIDLMAYCGSHVLYVAASKVGPFMKKNRLESTFSRLVLL